MLARGRCSTTASAPLPAPLQVNLVAPSYAASRGRVSPPNSGAGRIVTSTLGPLVYDLLHPPPAPPPSPPTVAGAGVASEAAVAAGNASAIGGADRRRRLLESGDGGDEDSDAASSGGGGSGGGVSAVSPEDLVAVFQGLCQRKVRASLPQLAPCTSSTHAPMQPCTSPVLIAHVPTIFPAHRARPPLTAVGWLRARAGLPPK